VAWTTAWLYSRFAQGTLAGYNFYNAANFNNGSGLGYETRAQTAGDLQMAIWYAQGLVGSLVANGFEGESGRDGTFFYHEAIVAAGAAGVTIDKTHYSGEPGGGLGYDTPANGAFNVMALNLGAPGTVQDQLILVPEPTTMIAGVLLLLPFAASTVRIVRRSSAA